MKIKNISGIAAMQIDPKMMQALLLHAGAVLQDALKVSIVMKKRRNNAGAPVYGMRGKWLCEYLKLHATLHVI